MLIAVALHRKKVALLIGTPTIICLYLLATPALTLLTGRTLEYGYPYVPLNNVETADAIVCLGGGVSESLCFCPEPLLNAAADRPYYSAVLWKAGKAPVIIPSGVGIKNSDAKFLLSLGVPENVIVVENSARNTEENARLVEQLIKAVQENQIDTKMTGNRKPKILLVTSAWHMKRSLLIFSKYASGLKVVPAPTDHECLRGDGAMRWEYLRPDAACIELNVRYIHEWMGWIYYKYFKR